MPINAELYSRKASRDIRGAMALALRRHLEGLTFKHPGDNVPLTFSEVYEEWPSYESRYTPPVAVVMPGSWQYKDWSFTPHLLEDTWERQGEEGFGLYKLSEMESLFEVSVRTNSAAERDSITRGIEESFRAPALLMDEDAGPRYGVMLLLPEYYSMDARFSLMGARISDDENTAVREQRDVTFTIKAEGSQVTVGKVYPLNLKVRITQC